MAQVHKIDNLEPLRNHPVVMLTGGEPMLNIERTLSIVWTLREQIPARVILMYSAFFGESVVRHRLIGDLMDAVDGVHYTIHADAGYKEVNGHSWFQDFAAPRSRVKSYRLYVDPRCRATIHIDPSIYQRVTMTPWQHECKLPSNEMLFELPEEFKP
jgi:hypothetical protein